MVDGGQNSFNQSLGIALTLIAREWVKVDGAVQAELKRLLSKVPVPLKGLTDKNKRFLRQFDDPNALRRLVLLPEQLWAEVKRERSPTYRTLAKAQAALAIGILIYMPIRLQNLVTLEFERHLFIRTRTRGKIHTGIVEWRGQEQHRPSVRDSAADRQDVGRVSRKHRSENHW